VRSAALAGCLAQPRLEAVALEERDQLFLVFAKVVQRLEIGNGIAQVAIGLDRDQFPRARQPVQRVAQVLAHHALDLLGVGHDASSVPYSVSHLTAVFGPTFGTPGTLSTASPISDR
jgi:hypothetical protein